ncbi:type II toxin-antitoxin system Phd/YefM family antitoxin [Photobacterium atrarenae]|uniref:Type II toxin-antitoxin system Phd/YefM family antitoxin n=1 Tax=Photobacterium atrarenae TaxID=865757 RepID=A0ABY5GNA6_9GAMM|nr:type II toxin-antitoxin system Phd/YefM family antitoxin [Photobacterium atrarenae]UTV30818.1 type II toxin-antitoxin system Phd/YefM family antitoxin [Photobacterium atrarenae]
MNIQTVSYLKTHAAKLDLDEPMVITQNGKPAYVIESYEARQRRDNSIAMMKLLAFSQEDKTQGRVMSSDSLKSRLAARKQKAQSDDGNR